MKPTRPDGQLETYETLPEAERTPARPVRDQYKHTVCGAITRMSQGIAETYASDPGFYTRTFCWKCRDHFPVAEFRWPDGEVVGS